MSETNSTNHSAVSNTGADQSTATPAVSEPVETSTENQGNEDFNRELDEDWGIPVEDEPDETDPPVVDDPDDGSDPDDVEEIDDPDDTEDDDPVDDDAPAEPTLRVNFLGQAYDLPEAEARKYAQIGMNAGRLQSQYEALKPLEALREPLEVLATFQDRPLEDVIKDLGSMVALRQSEVAALVEQGHDQALAEELFDSKWDQAKQKRALNRAKDPKEKGLTEYQKEQILQFSKLRPEAHREVTEGKPLPEDVLENWRSGMDLTTAWLLHENNELTSSKGESSKEVNALKKEIAKLKKENTNLRKNAENRQKAPTRKKGTGGGTGGVDIFAGWGSI